MSARTLGGSLLRNPDLDTWIRVEPDGTVTLFTGKVELGQGLRSAIARIGAEELDLLLDQVQVHTADTAEGPNEFYTAGSMSLEDSGNAVRQAAAEARQVLLELASEKLGAPIGQLEVEAGVIRAVGSQRAISYGELFGGQRFERRISGEAVPKAAEQHRIVGRPGPRIDLAEKLVGGGFLHDRVLPDMLHGRVLRPPSYGAELESVDLESVAALPGVVTVVRDGHFLGVVAEREEQAVLAREALAASASWSEASTLPADQELGDFLLAQPVKSFPVVEGEAIEGEVPVLDDPPGAAQTLEASYFRPFQMHASIGPSAAIAQTQGESLTVWTHSQGPAILRLSLAEALRRDAEGIHVIHADGPGCYGHNGADDAALDAALLAQAVPGRPVRLQWMRDDEHAWEPYGPAMAMRLRASLDRRGEVQRWSHDVYGYTHMGRPLPYGTHSQLIAAWHRQSPLPPPPLKPSLGHHAGIHRNADPLYAFPQRRVVKHMVVDRILRTSSMRGLGAFANVFAIESFMDELAHAADVDPVEFRLRHLEDARARAVIEAAAEHANWGTRPGQGIGFARYKNAKCYAAVVVELEVDGESGAIRLRRATLAGDAGQVVDPEGLRNQLEGGFVQAASWTLREAVRFDRTRVTSRDWDSYPILTFPEIPEIETVLLDRPDEPFLGSGEGTQGPTPAAIANAIFHATGARLRQLPFTPEQVRAELAPRS